MKSKDKLNMESIVNLFKGQVITSQHLNIPSNQKIFTITCGGKTLKENLDYKLEYKKGAKFSKLSNNTNNSLILNSNFLLTLPSYPLGEVAIINCVFADDTSWKIRVFQLELATQEKTPEQIAKKRKSIGFAIGGAGIFVATTAIATKIMLARRKNNKK